jgi:hypothetical protein
MYHVGRPGEDHFELRMLQAWGVDEHDSRTSVCSASARPRVHAVDGGGPDLPATIPEVREFQAWYSVAGHTLVITWENGDV